MPTPYRLDAFWKAICVSRTPAFTPRVFSTDGTARFAKDIVLGCIILILTSLMLAYLALADPAFATGHDVRMDVHDGAFEHDTNSLKASWATSIDKLVDVLGPEPSTLRMTYYTAAGDRALARARMALLRRAVEQRWESAARNYKLPIEILIVYRNE
jgi:hypothetical protein